MRYGRHTTAAVVLAASAALATACGTTATFPSAQAGNSGLGAAGGPTGPSASNLTRTRGAAASSGTGSGGPVALTGGSTSNGSAGGTVASGDAGAVPAGSTPGGPSASPGTAAPAGAASGSAPGVTATTITIGVSYVSESDSSTANAAIGGAGISQGDSQGEIQTMINYLNSHGGVAGRKLVPVWNQLSATSTEPANSQYQSECQNYEQDHKVFAIFDGENPVIEQCAQQAGAVEMTDNVTLASAKTYAEYPSYFEVSSLDLNRIVLNEAQALDAQHYFTPWNATVSGPGGLGAKTKVGILAYSSPDFDYAVDDVLIPELSRLGYAPSSSDVVTAPEPQNEAQVSNDSAAVSSAVLRFRADGVDHVLIVDGSGILTLLFLNNAESQHYYPRYGWNSQNGPQALLTPGDVPKDQLNGSMGIGWIPGIDLPAANNPDNGPYSNPARVACLALLRSAGYTFPNPNAEQVALGICATFEFFKTVADTAGRTLDQASFIASADHLGAWGGAGDGFGNYYSASQHDGGAYYRYYAWNGSCGCMQYTSGNETAVGEGEP